MSNDDIPTIPRATLAEGLAQADAMIEAAEGARRDDPLRNAAVALPTAGFAGDYVTRDELQRLRDNLTMGDTWRARALAPDDARQRGMLGLYFAAVRSGLAEAPSNPGAGVEAEFYGFMDRVKVDDVNEVLSADAEAQARGPKSTDGQA